MDGVRPPRGAPEADRPRTHEPARETPGATLASCLSDAGIPGIRVDIDVRPILSRFVTTGTRRA